MVFTSDRPISVDGVRLDTLAWNVEAIKRATAARRDASVSVPGRDGSLPSLNDDLEPATLGLDMFVRGTDEDGAVPAGGQRDRMRANLDELIHLFGARHRLIEVIQQTGPGTEARQYVDDPNAISGTKWTAGAAPGAAASSSGRNGYRVGPLTAGGATPYAISENDMAGWRTGTRVRIVVDASYEGVTGSTGGLRAEVRWRNSSGTLIGATPINGWAPGAAGVFTQGSLYVVPPAGAASFTAIIFPTGGWLDGEYIFLDNWWVTDADDGAVFSGASAPGALYTYLWAGAVNASTSVRYPTARRRALAKVVDVMTPELNAIGSSGRFTAGLEIPSGVWEDALVATRWASAASAASGAVQEVTTLQGSAERITDAVILVQGPANAPRLTDPTTGAYVALGTNLAAGQLWRINVGTWNTRYGAVGATGWEDPAADNRGTDGQAVTTYGGMIGQAAFLPLTPTRTPTDPTRRVMLALTAGGLTASSRMFVSARRKYPL